MDRAISCPTLEKARLWAATIASNPLPVTCSCTKDRPMMGFAKAPELAVKAVVLLDGFIAGADLIVH
jgi:hypothetical protein